MAGYIYTCRSLNNPLVFKGGFTTSECPEQYCHEEYSRTMSNLEVFQVLHVPRARLAESTLFLMLDRFRNDPVHEMFTVESTSDISYAFEGVIDIFNVMALRDPAAQLSGRIPLSREEYTGKVDKIVKKLVKEIFRSVVRETRRKKSKTADTELITQLQTTALRQKKMVDDWFDKHVMSTENRTDALRPKKLHDLFLSTNPAEKIALQVWGQLIEEKTRSKMVKGYKYYWGLVVKI